MNLKDFKILEMKLQEAVKGLLGKEDRISVFIRSLDDERVNFTGTDCVVCLVKILNLGIEEGAIKHKALHINDEEDEKDEKDEIKH